MKTRSTTQGVELPTSWFGTLSEENIDLVASLLRQRLYGQRFTIASTMYANSGDAKIECKTDCVLTADWTDRSDEQIRVMTHEDGTHWVGFSAGGYFWTFNPIKTEESQISDRYPYFAFEWGNVEVHIRAPAGHIHKHLFARQRRLDH